jgi:hypothetical protein
LLGAAIITASVIRSGPSLAQFLPGVWAICFGIGIFASRQYLVRASGWVALYFYAAGALLLWMAGQATLNPWAVGGVFGAGQLMTAAVLYWNLESRE